MNTPKRITGYIGGIGGSKPSLKQLAMSLGRDFDGDVFSVQEIRNQDKIKQNKPYIRSVKIDALVNLIYSDFILVIVDKSDYDKYSEEMNDLDREDVIREFAIEVVSLRPEFPKGANDLMNDINKTIYPDPQVVAYCEADVLATLDLVNAWNGVTE